MSGNDEANNDWLAVIGRALALLCLVQTGQCDKDLATQGRFLESVGLSRKEAAALLGTSSASLTQQLSVAKRKGGTRDRQKKG